MPETNTTNILYRRSRRLRVLTGNKTLRSEQDVIGGQVSWLETFERMLVRPFVLAFTEPILICLNLYIALINSLLFSTLITFPLVFQDIFVLNVWETCVFYIVLFVGSVVAVPPTFYYLHYHLRPQFSSSGTLTPEKRLPPAIVGACIIPIALLIFGWSARPSIHWIVPIFGSSLSGVANVLLYYSILNYIPDSYPDVAACAFAGNECLSCTAAAVFPLIATPLFKRLGIQWTFTLLAALAACFVPVPIALYYKGHIVRGRSHKAKKAFGEEG